ASSNLAVRFDAQPAGLAQIVTGGASPVLTQLSGGRVTVTAFQDGSANFWPADPVPQILRLPPLITSFSASGTEIVGGMTLSKIDEALRVVALDADGISQAEFFIRPAGNGPFTSLGVDNIPGNGLGVNLPIDAYATGQYELKVAVSTPSGFTNEVTRVVRLELGPPPRPILKTPANGSYFDTPLATIHGVGSRGAQVFIMRNGVDVAGPLSAFEFSANITLLPGENVFTARAVNAAGESPASLPLTYTLRSLLTVQVNPSSSLTEGEARTVRVIRNHAQGAVAVALSASVPGQLTLPASVTIPDAATEASVQFTAVDDTKAEADQVVTITGSAGNYVSGSTTVTVLDNDRTNLPDLIVTGITAPAQALPGQQIEIVWTLKNQGPGKAAAGWTDQILISEDHVIGSDQLIGTSAATAALPAGQSIERRAFVTVPSLSAGAKYIITRTNAGGDVFEENPSNNTSIDDAALTIQTALALNLSRTSAPENLGVFNATVTRNGDTSTALVVALAAAPGGLVTLPPSATIAANESSATFAITTVNDDVVNGTRNTTITAQAAGYANATADLAVTDDDSATLAIEIAPGSVPETAANPAATGTVRRNTGTSAALTVSLVSSNPTAATAPATVVIPAGQTTATFPVTIYDDDVRTANRTARFTAAAAGLATTSATIELIDDDVPGITLRLTPDAASENAPNPASRGRIARDRVATGDVIIRLTSSDPASVVVPAEVTIPVEATAVDFPITVLDNANADGARNVTITATETDGVLHLPIAEQSVSATLHVFDDEGATLALTASAATIVTGNAVNGTVSRQPGTVGAVLVALASSDPAIIVPANVQIANNQASATFSIQAAAGLTSPASATVTASAPGLNSAALAITAISAAQPDLAVVEVTPSAATATGGSTMNVSWMVENDGSADATGSWLDRVFLTADQQATGGSAGLVVAAVGPVVPGAGYTRTAEITLPSAPGRYWVVVQTDAQGSVTEGSESNNSLVGAVPIDVAPAYRVTVSTSVELAASGTPVPLAGQALRTGDDAPMANVPVSLRILVNGTRRVLNTLTDANGNYLTTFRPLATEAGHYTVAAAQPDVKEDVVQDQFDLIGVGADPAGLELRLTVNQPVSGEIDLRNTSERALTGLTGLTAVAQTGAGNIVTLLTPPAALAAGATAKLHYTMTATSAAFTRAKVVFHITSVEGAVLDVPVQVTVLPLAAQLVANPGTLTRGMLRGAQSLVECELVNLGSAPSGDLNVELPTNFPWMTLASPAAIPALAPGERTKITLQLLPAANQPLQLYTGTIFVRGAQTGLSIPFQFRAISDAVGDVRINVLDDYTYYTAGAPRVADATVRLRDPFDQSIIVAQGLTDATGSVTLPAVREGSYFLEVSAEKHGTYRNGFVVVPGITNTKDVFIDRQTVTYRWSVVPTEIPDRYEIKLVATFEVDVPVPVVTMEVTPSNAIPELLPGESLQVDVTLTNHGLIAAEQIALNVPGIESGFEFIPLIRQLDSIAAKSSVTIPMIIRRNLPGFAPAALRNVARASGGVDCTPFIFAIYSYECGLDRRYHQVGQPFIVQGEICPGGGGGGIPIFPGGVAGGPGGTVIIGPGVETSDDCDPCGAIKLKAVLKCVEKFLPFPDWFKCGKGVLTCSDLYTCTRTGMTCAKAAGASIPFGKPLKVLDCIYIFIKAYEECQKKLAGGGDTKSITTTRFQVARNAAGALVADAATATALGSEELATIKERAVRMQDEVDALIYLFGDDAWIASEDPATWNVWIPAFLAAAEATSEAGEHISTAERQSLLALALPADITTEVATRLIDRNNRSLDYYAAGIFNSTEVPPGGSSDFVARDILHSKFERAAQGEALGIAEGFATTSEGVFEALNQLRNAPQKKTQGVCARVKMEIDQQAVLTRQAFLGTLEVTNGSETNTIEGVSVVLDIRDANGASANDKFFIKGPDVSGLADAGGRGALAPGAVGRLQYTFIPKRDAAPDAPTVYSFSGTLMYTDNGQQVSLPMLPSPVTVYPDARLVLKYFLKRDVYSDDPFTPQVEPAEPFSLGLVVTNEGRGIAKNFSITSAQPKIIENKKGLLIDFKIIGAQVGAEAREPSLTVNLGDIDPGEAQVAQFILTASLQGKFIDYQASYEHADELGGQATSLIDGVEIHELIHVVRDDRPAADDLPDFLTNEVADVGSLPDTLYLSTGVIAPVNLATNASATIGTLQGALTANMPTGWSYVDLADPGAGLKLVRVVRSDGKVIRVGDNVWQTDRTFPNELTGARRERLLHLLDFDGTGSYALYYTTADGDSTLAPPVQIAQLGPVNPALRVAPLDSIDVTFTRPIDPASLTAADVKVSVNGAPGVVANGVTISPLGETAYRISGFAGLNAAEGTYSITVSANTVTDVTGRAGQGAATAVWALSTTRLAVVSAGAFG
ncbi:MAG: CARDB domain-containing protein, partial [Chthoniobacteraceae bacterium]